MLGLIGSQQLNLQNNENHHARLTFMLPPLLFFWSRNGLPHFFHSRIATGSAADHYYATTRTDSLHPPPPKIESSLRFNAVAKEGQNMVDTKHKKRPAHYKDTMRPQQAIRSKTEHICTTMFNRSRIIRALPLCY